VFLVLWWWRSRLGLEVLVDVFDNLGRFREDDDECDDGGGRDEVDADWDCGFVSNTYDDDDEGDESIWLFNQGTSVSFVNRTTAAARDDIDTDDGDDGRTRRYLRIKSCLFVFFFPKGRDPFFQPLA